MTSSAPETAAPFIDRTTVSFSHRPVYGVSVGFYAIDNQLCVAASFVFDGSNCRLVRKKKPDQFSYKTATGIIVNKIKNKILSPEANIPYCELLKFDEGVSASGKPLDNELMYQFMHKFRANFKPDPLEVDRTNDPLAGVEEDLMHLRTDAWPLILDVVHTSMIEVME